MGRTHRTNSRKKGFRRFFGFRLFGGTRRAFFISLPYALLLTSIGLLCGSMVAYAINSPIFELKEVRVLNVGTLSEREAFEFCELKKGENLITLDLLNVQQVIRRKHPQFREIQVRRILPNRVEVELKRRIPVAQIFFSSRYFQVDKDLVILPGSSKTPYENLTTIEGTPRPRRGLAVGAVIEDPATKKAVKLAEVIRATEVLKGHVLERLEIARRQHITLIVDSDIEIKMGNGRFIERLKVLEQTLKTIELDRSKISYIDLRFDDVVIGPR